MCMRVVENFKEFASILNLKESFKSLAARCIVDGPNDEEVFGYFISEVSRRTGFYPLHIDNIFKSLDQKIDISDMTLDQATEIIKLEAKAQKKGWTLMPF